MYNSSNKDGGSIAINISSSSSNNIYKEADDKAAASVSSYKVVEVEDDLYKAFKLGLKV